MNEVLHDNTEWPSLLERPLKDRINPSAAVDDASSGWEIVEDNTSARDSNQEVVVDAASSEESRNMQEEGDRDSSFVFAPEDSASFSIMSMGTQSSSFVHVDHVDHDVVSIAEGTVKTEVTDSSYVMPSVPSSHLQPSSSWVNIAKRAAFVPHPVPSTGSTAMKTSARRTKKAPAANKRLSVPSIDEDCEFGDFGEDQYLHMKNWGGKGHANKSKLRPDEAARRGWSIQRRQAQRDRNGCR